MFIKNTIFRKIERWTYTLILGTLLLHINEIYKFRQIDSNSV